MTEPTDPFQPPAGPPPLTPQPSSWPHQPPQWGPPPPQQQWAYGQPQWQPPRSTNGLAIGALVSSFLCFPVAIVLGIVALVQTKDGRQSGRGLAIGALCVSGAWVLIFGAIIIAGVNGAFDETEHRTGRVAQAGSTQVGECMLSHQQPDGVSRVVDCEVDHDQEVYYVDQLPAGDFPGPRGLENTAEHICLNHFAAYVGQQPDTDDLDFSYYAPSASEWSEGERRLVCVVIPSVDDTIDYSARRA